jgi:hypothetical protein
MTEEEFLEAKDKILQTIIDKSAQMEQRKFESE